ncbi:MAG TPA: hypothetical protein VMP86_00625 [Candidatus Binatia bacterium]|nr:hypothetical protein [Candidatus Binatia bacterium]
MPESRFRMPDLTQPHKYEHQRPRRPSHLPKRLTPPPERAGAPDLSLFLYAGIVLALILVVLAIPYLIGYLFEVIRF